MPDHDPQTIDRVARALSEEDCCTDCWDVEGDDYRNRWRSSAIAALDAMPQPIAWMTARLWDDYSWPGDGEWTIRQPTYKSEDAARADAGSGGVVVALIPVDQP